MGTNQVVTDSQAKLIHQLHQRIESTVKREEQDLHKSFVSAFFDQYPIKDFNGRALDDVYGMAANAYQCVKTWSKRPKVTVLNPSQEEHQWVCPHTVVMVHCANMPFLMDSVRMALTKQDLTVHSVKHTALITQRDSSGNAKLTAIIPADSPYQIESNEALLYFEIKHLTKVKDLKAVASAIRSTLKDVASVNNDHSNMLKQLPCIRQQVACSNKYHSAEEIGEASQFLNWLMINNFIFLGYAYFNCLGRYSSESCTLSYGLLKDESAIEFIVGHHGQGNTRQKKSKPPLLSFHKLPVRSTIHRKAYPDHIVIKAYDDKGKAVGEHHIMGLYTSVVYRASVLDIPVVREKVKALYKAIKTDSNSYNGKVIRQVLETYPRDELFQSTAAELTETLVNIAQINERHHVRLYMRKDTTSNFVSSMVYIPRDIFSTRLRNRILSLLSSAVGAESTEFYTYYSESILARTYFIFRVKTDKNMTWKVDDLEQQVKELARTWLSSLEDILIHRLGEDSGTQRFKYYEQTFSPAYQENYTVEQAVKDIDCLQQLSVENPMSLDLCRSEDPDSRVLHFKIYHYGSSLILSEVIPMLERMNLNVLGEQPYRFCISDKVIWMHDFELQNDPKLHSQSMPYAQQQNSKERFEKAFKQIWLGMVENDAFNGLILSANLHWREVVVLRAYAAYMKQTLFPVSKHAIAKTLMDYPKLVRSLVSLFHHYFDPDCKERKTQEIIDQLHNDLDEVDNLNDDRIVRRYMDLMSGTVRTNFYQKEQGLNKDYLSFKFNPREIADIPEPKPQYEIFVYSPRVEGVHLRGGKVARGGLRWSDRFEDYRTEVLGLVKAQQVKNAVIVPSGAKGGFVAKRAAHGFSQLTFFEEGVECYQIFIRGLLDITDNLLKGKVVPPERVVCRDDDDPYLVVAADKGTATFSDIANEISLQYGHWLGDAFASGGSQGYDHKGMGITARGAWVSVQRHFKEKGLNVQKEGFSVIAIGDMGGDVFGNGMLMSEHIALLAAFNHLHIFIDPKPDVKKSFKERKRLFEGTANAWTEYNRKLISKGGGIFARNAKSIAISTEMKKCFGLNQDALTPNELIKALLKSSVDLIWNGGIGTYVKSASENHSDIGDKANDALRINGAELRCRVFGEGGNLGMSQLGRIEFALHGGACNTDFIDNAAGVDCSDHEVNIKILLNDLVANGQLGLKQRNQLLSSMTDTVATMVLTNNYRQTQSISVAEYESQLRLGECRRLIVDLENSGRLNRDLEFIPSEEEFTERKANGQALTRPELAVLSSYVKVQLKEALAVDEISENAYLSVWVEKAFPKKLLTKYQQAIQQHILRQEIIATQLANDIVDNMGITFIHRLVESTGKSAAEIALAYVVARDVFRFEEFQAQVEALDYKVPANDQLSLLITMMRRVRRGTRWFLRNYFFQRHFLHQQVVQNQNDSIDLAKDIQYFRSAVTQVIQFSPMELSKNEKIQWEKNCAYYQGLGLNDEWSNAMAMPGHLFSGLGVVGTAAHSGVDINTAVKMHHLLGDKLDLYWFAHAVTDVRVDSHWQAMARESFIDDIDKVLRVMSVALIRLAGEKYQQEEALQLWMQEYPLLVLRWREIAHELQTNPSPDFAMFAVAIRELLDLMDACDSCDTLKFG